jgi:hypothetical protein
MGADLILELILLPICMAFAVLLGTSLDGDVAGDTAVRPSLAWRRVRALLLCEAALVGLVGIELGLWWRLPSIILFFAVQVITASILALLGLRTKSPLRSWTTGLLAGVWLIAGIPVAITDALNELAGPGGGTLLGTSGPVIVSLVVSGGPILFLASSFVGSGTLARRSPHRGFGVLLGLLSCAVIAWPVSSATAALTAGGCAPTWLVPADPYLCVRANLNGNELEVAADTSLPDGTVLLLERGDFLLMEDADATRLVVRNGLINGRVTVSDRSTLYLVLRIAPWTPYEGDDDYLVLAKSDQPEAVVIRYGQDGSGMVGLRVAGYGGSGMLHSSAPMQAIVIVLEIDQGHVTTHSY